MMRLIVVLAATAAACSGGASSPDSTTTTTMKSIVPSQGTPSTMSDDGTGTGSMVCWTAEPSEGSPGIAFADVTAEAGLVAPLSGMHGHAAAWGDVNNDGIADLVVGTFANRPQERYQVRGASGPSPDTLMLGQPDGSFTVSPGFPPVLGRTSGSAIVDLDNDGDEDILLSRNMRDRERGTAPSQIYRNDGDSFTLVDLDLGRFVSGRSVGIFDYNRDGLLDVLLLEDHYGGGRSSVLLENNGDMRFTDATRDAGIPDGLTGLGVATGDLNGDRRTDFFVGGSNRLFVAGNDGFIEVPSENLQWEAFGDEDDVAGASIGDLNRDGRPDLVVGHHYNSTLSQDTRVPLRIYLNQGNDADGLPQLVDVTEDAGLEPLPTKAPHVEIADLDNDGWPDILSTASAADGGWPAVFRNEGAELGGTPSFAPPPGLGSAQYWVAGPTADVDRDGRLDVFLVEWEPELPSLMLRNESRSGNWLEVSVSADQPIGSTVWVWEAGGLDDPARLIGMREIVVSQGYTSGHLAIAHFGIGTASTVDVRIVSPDGTSLAVTEVTANGHIRVPGGC